MAQILQKKWDRKLKTHPGNTRFRAFFYLFIYYRLFYHELFVILAAFKITKGEKMRDVQIVVPLTTTVEFEKKEGHWEASLLGWPRHPNEWYYDLNLYQEALKEIVNTLAESLSVTIAELEKPIRLFRHIYGGHRRRDSNAPGGFFSVDLIKISFGNGFNVPDDWELLFEM